MTFAKEVSDFVIKTDGLKNRQIRFLCLDLLKGCVLGTPVDTGRARGNWQASVNNSIDSDTTDTDKIGLTTIAAGENAAKAAPGEVFYITNNLPYIYRLEFEGWSQQKPSGWVRTAIERTKQIAKDMPSG